MLFLKKASCQEFSKPALFSLTVFSIETLYDIAGSVHISSKSPVEGSVPKNLHPIINIMTIAPALFIVLLVNELSQPMVRVRTNQNPNDNPVQTQPFLSLMK